MISRVRGRQYLALVFLAACSGGGGGGSAGADPPSGIVYSEPAPSYAVCAQIPANTPTVTGGQPTSFSVAPALPNGLTLDPLTGVISGAPAAVAAPTTVTVTASNSAGAAATNLQIEVLSADPVGIDYGGATLDFAVGIDAALYPALASGIANSWSVISGGLPDGLLLDPSSGAIVGAPSHVPSNPASLVRIRAANCTGATTLRDVTVRVVPAIARAAYVLNDAEPLLSCYQVEGASGLLRSGGWHELLDAAPSTLATTPNGRWLLVAEGNTASIRTYACGELDGRLTDTLQWNGTGSTPAVQLAVHPKGRFVYAITHEDVVVQMALDPATGALSDLATATVGTGAEPAAIALDPRGRFAYVANALDATISCYRIDAGSGQLLPVTTVACGRGPSDLVVSPDSAWLIVANSLDASISVFAVQAANGALSAVAGSPFPTVAGTTPSSLAIDPSSGFLYVGHAFEPLIEQYSIASGSGALFALSPPRVDLPNPASDIQLEPGGQRLYAFVYRDGWNVFDIAGGGSLSPSVSPLVVGRATPRAIAFQPGAVAAAAVAENAYAASSDGRVIQLGLAAAGTLTPLAPLSVPVGALGSSSVAVHPRLERVYVSNGGATPGASVSLLSVDSGGALTLAGTSGTQPFNHSLQVDRSGRMAFQSVGTSPGRVQPYAVDPLDGTLTALQTADCGDDPRGIAVHPGGRWIFVPCFGSDTIDVFEVDWATGELVFNGSTLTADAPSQVAITESGAHLLTLESTTSTIVVYRVDVLYGSLRPLSAGFNDIGSGVTAFAVDPLGEYVIASGLSGTTLRAFRLDSDDGRLTPTAFQLVAPAATSLRFDPSGGHLYATESGNRVAHYAFDGISGLALADSITAGSGTNGLDLRVTVR